MTFARRDDGPDHGNETAWQASPRLAFAIRAAAFLIPLLSAFTAVRLLSGLFLRPPGWAGFGVWIAQATVVGSVASLLVDRATRQLLPLARLFDMSLVFPDQAPSRFGVALRSGTLRKLQRNLDDVRENGLGTSEDEAARRAVELIAALGRHDRLTRGHTERVRAYADLIGEELGLSAADRGRLSWAALLHDIGKLQVAPEVLNKEGSPTEEEWVHLRSHPAESAGLLEPLADWLGEWIGAASEHHERWDGTGYPRGLAGTEISLAGRIVAVADAFDVVTSKRSYKEPLSSATGRRELVDNAGTQFDPTVVRAFLGVSLGKRWMVGPLAWLADLPIGQVATTVTASPAIVAVGAVAAVTSLAPLGLAPQEASPGSLAFSEPIVPVLATPEPSSTLVELTEVSVVATLPPEPWTSASTLPPTSTTQPPPTTTSTAPTTTTTVPTTATTTTTTAPTTTAPTTTTTAPTTTSSTTTTTTAPPPATRYHLKNPSTGDTMAQLFKSLEEVAVDDATQPNFDTDRDSIPGLRLESTPDGWLENDLVQIQRFGMDPSDDLDGPVSLTLFAATDQPVGAPVTLRIALSDCNWAYSGCSNVVESSVSVSNPVGSGFTRFDIDFGSVSHTFDPGRRLVVRFITEDGETLHTGFDSVPNPAALDVTWD